MMTDHKWSVRFRPSVRNDLAQAISWYKHEAAEQIPRFVAEYEKAIDLIATQPYLFPERIGVARCYSLRVFPYGIWYVLDEPSTTVHILAIYHFRRNPDRLRKQLDSNE